MSVITDALKAAQREKLRRKEAVDPGFTPVLVRLRTQPRQQRNRSQMLVATGLAGAVAIAAFMWMRGRNDAILPAVPPVTSAILDDALADTAVVNKPIVQQAARPDSSRALSVQPGSSVSSDAASTASVRPRLAAGPSRTAAPAQAPSAPESVDRTTPTVARVNRSGTLDIAVEAPRDADAARLFSEAVAAHRAGALDIARPLYERVLAIAPNDGDALNNLGVILSGDRQFDRALDLLRRATVVSPRHAGAWNNIGAALREQGKSAEAIAAFRQALSIDPAHQGARVGLAQQYLSTNVPALARDLLTSVLESNPALAEAHYTLGQVHEQLGDRRAAIASYSAFIRYAPARLAGHVDLVRKRMESLATAP